MNTIIRQVKRKRSPFAPLLQTIMILFAVLFLFAGVLIDRGMMLPCFLMTALYYGYRTLSQREYEYTFNGHELTIDSIYGGNFRRCAMIGDLREMLVLAPHDSSAVADYRKGGSKQVAKKYDFTSYEEHLPYYTMILKEDGKIVKVLLDLDQELLDYLKPLYPGQVFRS